jgi:hypothetical protein
MYATKDGLLFESVLQDLFEGTGFVLAAKSQPWQPGSESLVREHPEMIDAGINIPTFYS